ncbi:hypothetical protein AB0P17_06875 [Streptomyces sp. NPDC088124]|uniref:hypothetical protein n=1 Tax=Streptomyces sp. NPDC088124 TaxID=3154654 RepID=UPI003430EE50
MEPIATGTPPAPAPRTRTTALTAVAPRALLAAVPVASLGILGFVPSLVIAIRRRGRAHWLISGAFTAVTVAWVAQIALTPDETHGLEFLADMALLLTTTAGAALHSLLTYRPRTEPGTGP